MPSVIFSAKSICLKRHIIIWRIIVNRKAAFNTILLSVFTYIFRDQRSCNRLTTIIYDIQSSNIQSAHHFDNLETMSHVDYIPVRSNHYPLFGI